MQKTDNRIIIQEHGARLLTQPIMGSWREGANLDNMEQRIQSPFQVVAFRYACGSSLQLFIETSHLPNVPFVVIYTWGDKVSRNVRTEIEAILTAERLEAERLREEQERLTTH